MNRLDHLFLAAMPLLLLAGCASVPPAETVVDDNAAMAYLEEGLKPEVLLFPVYLLGSDVELDQHGRVPGTRMVGAGMKVNRPLATVRREFMAVLEKHGWTVGAVEDARQSFRLMASGKGETLELRAVQGAGPTHIFLLYTPAPSKQ